MKTGSKLAFTLLLFISATAHSKPQTPVFHCSSHIQIDATTSEAVSMRTFEAADGSLFTVGSGLATSARMSTVKNVLDLQSAFRMTGVSAIFRLNRENGMDPRKVLAVVVYTAGNFDDDQSGLRGVEFRDLQNKVIGSGLFVGWGGPALCGP